MALELVPWKKKVKPRWAFGPKAALPDTEQQSADTEIPLLHLLGWARKICVRPPA